jgi:hypothetical protein
MVMSFNPLNKVSKIFVIKFRLFYMKCMYITHKILSVEFPLTVGKPCFWTIFKNEFLEQLRSCNRLLRRSYVQPLAKDRVHGAFLHRHACSCCAFAIPSSGSKGLDQMSRGPSSTRSSRPSGTNLMNPF